MKSLHPLRILFLILAIGGTLVASVPVDYEFITCEIKPSKKSSHRQTHPRIPFSRDPQDIQSSDNWSGYFAGVNLTQPIPYTVTKVSGSWTVPTVIASNSDTFCAIWVGMDGSGSPTVQQIGTSHDIENGHVRHYAWFEMYPQASNDIVRFPVEVGDTITASVIYVPSSTLPANNDLFILQLVNDTKKVFTSIPYITKKKKQRVCAEWIVEAPAMNGTLPLAQFDKVYFSNCVAEINNILGAINNPAWANAAINMVASNGTLKAITSALSPDGQAFFVEWRHS